MAKEPKSGKEVKDIPALEGVKGESMTYEKYVEAEGEKREGESIDFSPEAVTERFGKEGAAKTVMEEGKGFYAIQTQDEGDDWIYLRKGNGKIAKSSKKDSALEVMNKILDKRGDARARIVFAENVKGQREPAIKRVEVEMSQDGRADARKNEISPELVELYGKDRAEQLAFMDAEERGAVLHLLQQVREKQEALNSFGVLAAQRSAFRGNTKNLKSLEKLKGKIAKARGAAVVAKEEYETAMEAGKLFAEKQTKTYPHLFKWFEEQMGIVETTAINSKTRKRSGAGVEGGKKALILKMFQEGKGQGKRLRPKDISAIMKAERTADGKPLEGVWEQYAVANPLKALRIDGYLAEDDDRRYYIP